jgi:hypothetical protein
MADPLPDSLPPAAPSEAPAPAPVTPAAEPLFRIAVVCDRCREEGFGGAEGFADLGDLLDFEPVPRKVARVDGWTPDRQRALIAAVAVCGSELQAARACGMAQYGVEQLKKHDGNESFLAALARAHEMARADQNRRLAAGVHAVTAPAAHWRPPEPAWGKAETRRRAREAAHAQLPSPPPPAPPAPANDAALGGTFEAFLRRALHLYRLKLIAERRARLAGQIAAADFYLRQASWIEVVVDLATADLAETLYGLRTRDGEAPRDVAATPASALFDAARRRYWAEAGEPERPELIPPHLLEAQDGYWTEPLPVIRGAPAPDRAEQARRQAEAEAEAARAQAEWEERAGREARAWVRAAAAERSHADAPAPPAQREETAPAGRPAPGE